MLRLVKYRAIVTLLSVVSVAAAAEHKQLIHSLDRILDFLLSDAANVDVDCLFGAVIAEAQLNLLLKHPLKLARYQQVKRLRAKCQNVIQTVRNLVRPPNEDYAKILRAILRPAGWHVDNGFSVGRLQVLPTLPWPATEDYLLEVMHEGSPQEAESDACIGQLVSVGAPEVEHVCTFSEECAELMTNFNTPCHGYPLTHRLLYVQAYRALNCTLRNDEFTDTTDMLCTRIYQEFRTLESLDQQITRDLYLEQVVLCGMEGYAEFLHHAVRTSMVQWQNPVGCFGTPVVLAAARERTKRASVLMTHGCDSHMTGLGVAALALNLRYIHVTK